MRHILHKANVIILREISVLLQIGAFMLWHSGKEVFDQLVRNQRMPQVKLGDVGL